MYKKILVAIDDSATSRIALAEAIHIARTSNAKLYITHVVDEIMQMIVNSLLAPPASNCSPTL